MASLEVTVTGAGSSEGSEEDKVIAEEDKADTKEEEDKGDTKENKVDVKKGGNL